MEFTLFTASCTGMESNCRYPQKREIQNAQDLKAAAQFDHVCAAYKTATEAGITSFGPIILF